MATTIEFFQEAMKRGTLFLDVPTGTATLYDTDGLRFKQGGHVLFMPRDEIELIPRYSTSKSTRNEEEESGAKNSRHGLNKYLTSKKPLSFKIKEIKEDGVIIVSRKEALRLRRDIMVAAMQAGQTFNFVVDRFGKEGGCAYLYKEAPEDKEEERVWAILRAKDFSVDYTPIYDVLKPGDVIHCKLNSTSNGTENIRVFVEPVEKYRNIKPIDYELYKPGELCLGKVCSFTDTGMYVRIDAGLDALCEIPRETVHIKDEVVIKLTKVVPDPKRKLLVRGKLVRVEKRDGRLSTEEFEKIKQEQEALLLKKHEEGNAQSILEEVEEIEVEEKAKPKPKTKAKTTAKAKATKKSTKKAESETKEKKPRKTTKKKETKEE